jgi:hypothetical protein
MLAAAKSWLRMPLWLPVSAGLVPPGTVYPARFRLVSNLPDGTYYWSVQAIDSGYAGSAFAPEAVFSYYHPTISSFSNVLYYPGAPPITVPFTVGDADSSADTLSVAAFASNTNLFSPSGFTFGGSGSNRTLTLEPAPLLVGTSVVSVDRYRHHRLERH